MNFSLLAKKEIKKGFFVFLNGKINRNFKNFYIANKHGKFSYGSIKDKKSFFRLKNIDPKIGYSYFSLTNDSLTIEPDEWGRVPLFFHYEKNKDELFCTFNFADIIKNYKLVIDDKEIIKQLYFGYSFSGKTIFRDTFVLSPYQKIEFNQKGFKLLDRDIKFKKTNDYKKPTLKAVDKKLNLILEEYFKLFSSYKLSISGGLDSRLLLAKWFEIKKSKPDCFTYGTKNDRDIVISKKITKEHNLNHKIFQIKPEDFIKNLENYVLFCGGTNTVTNSRAYNIYDNFKKDETIINGFMGDLTFGGGSHKRELLVRRSNNFFTSFLLTKLSKIELNTLSKLFGFSDDSLKQIIKKDLKPILKAIGNVGSLAVRLDKLLILSKVLYFGYWSVLFSAKQAGIITPLFDPRLNYFFLSIDSQTRYKHSLYKKYFLNKYPELAKYSWQKFGLNLYDEKDEYILSDKVNRRIPYERFFSVDLKKWVEKIIFARDAYLLKLVDKRILKQIVSYKKGDNNWADFIGQIISIETIIKLANKGRYVSK